MSKTTKAFINWGATAAFFACLWFGVIGGVEGAANVAVAFAWFCAFASLFIASEGVKQALDKLAAEGRTQPQWISIPLDFIAVGVFVWCGYWATGIAYLLHTILMEGAYSEAVERAAL